MAYDNARNYTVLFAGFINGGRDLGDTWEWDGAIWRQRANFGPATRREHAMVFDDNENRVVLFGGMTSTLVEGASNDRHLGDTWEWDGDRWLQRQNMGPQNRNSHALAYDSGRKRIILFGGAIANTLLGDTWEFAEQPST
jgi:hypothetical protein